MNQPINIVMLVLLLGFGGILICLRHSPDALDAVARKMRARARGLRASDKAYWAAYNRSLSADSSQEEVRKLVEADQL